MALLAVFALGASACSAAEGAGVEVAIDRNPITELIKPKLVSTIKDGQVGVSPGMPLAFQVEDGKFTEVTLANKEGRPVSGQLAGDGRSWATT
ncbi:Ig-like domain-containing protein, partial [Nocardia sp. NPDC060259]|uniref:Ig-like domain-containing protein n=1 Tax=Nocardia sp. NPDC060259 TaxID=3347088 RepID=UPI0036623573